MKTTNDQTGTLKNAIRRLLCRALGEAGCWSSNKNQNSQIQNSSHFTFPKDFKWGAALSAFQAEGAWNLDGKAESIWDRFAHEGRLKDGDTGDVACDQYHRFADDAALACGLSLNAYRLSISWPRVQPSLLGSYNQLGIDFYDRCIDQLLALGIEPFPTLYHWDLPQYLQDLGGWGNRDVVHRFADYAAEMSRRFSDRVSNWTTFNEPWCISYLGHESGYFAPGLKDRKLAAQVAHHLLVAHGLASQAIKAAVDQISPFPVNVGIVLSMSQNEPYRADNPRDVALAETGWLRDCGAYLNPLFRGYYLDDVAQGITDLRSDDMRIISQPLDFLGVNFYRRNVMSHDPVPQRIAGSEYTDMGWEVSPWALRPLLKRISDEYKPAKLYVTENGAAYVDQIDASGKINDVKRLEFLRAHIEQVALAMRDGVKIDGYFAWSLLDNLEWCQGFSQRFGLVHVDFKTQKRIIKASGEWYGRLAAWNKLELSGGK